MMAYPPHLSPEERALFETPCSSGKAWYPRLSAEATATMIWHHNPRKLMGVYECPECGGWHHTHKYDEARRRDRARKANKR